MRRLSSSVQQKGQVTIPLEIREAFNIHPGDEVYFRSSPQGILITTEELEKLAKFDEILDELSQLLVDREKEDAFSYSLDDIMETLREKRTKILKEKYSLDSVDE